MKSIPDDFFSGCTNLEHVFNRKDIKGTPAKGSDMMTSPVKYGKISDLDLDIDFESLFG